MKGSFIMLHARIIRAAAIVAIAAAAAKGQNAAPQPLNAPPGDTYDVFVSSTLAFTLEFGSPEPGQTTTVFVADGGLLNFSFVATPGNVGVVACMFSPTIEQCGDHVVTFVATDDGVPAASTTLALTLHVFGSLTVAMTQPGGPGSLLLRNICGNPGQLYFTAISSDPNNGGACLKCGWWFGLFIPLDDLLMEWSLGVPPFVGYLDAAGGSAFALPAGTIGPPLAGATCYALTVTFTPGSMLLDLVSAVTANAMN